MSDLRRSLAACTALALSVPLAAQDDAAELLGALPDEVLAVAIVAEPARAMDAFVEALRPVPPGLPAEAVARIGLVVAALKAGFEGSASEWAGRMLGSGIALAIVPAEPEPLVLAVSRPPDVGAALSWCGRHAARLHAVAAGPLLLASNRREGLELLRARAGRQPSRWVQFDFGAGLATDDLLRAAVDLDALRRLSGEQTAAVDRIAGRDRLVVAPVAAAYDAAKWLRLGMSPASLRLTLVADAGASAPYDVLIAKGAAGRQVVPLPEDGLAMLSVDRSLRALFADLDRFLPEADALAARGFLSIADALDGPHTSFVDDLLGGLEEPFTLHVLAPPPADGETSPFVLPEFALSAPVADRRVEPIVFRLAQVFATIANAERMQRGQGPFVVRRLGEEDALCLVAEPQPWRGQGLPPVDQQLSPTVWCGAGRIVIASTEAAARRLATAEASQRARGDLLVLRGPAIARLIEADRAVLELARMLDEGEDRAAAARFLDVVSALANDLAEVRLGCESDGSSTKLHVTLERRR